MYCPAASQSFVRLNDTVRDSTGADEIKLDEKNFPARGFSDIILQQRRMKKKRLTAAAPRRHAQSKSGRYE
ncbi:MAG: hypothetical protein SVR04_10175 [Spirochaetota bacterium]|nr:hypothetical protein [Spirochaetota bacterium]